jgi:antitoxin (DNA-binding transcriptional repressor) of toxin-antitoxin stability system
VCNGNGLHLKGENAALPADYEGMPGEEVVIARGNQPVVKLVALSAPQKTRGKRIPGQLKGKIFYTPDAFNPLTDQELKDEGFD